MPDEFKSQNPSITAPARDIVLVAPNDSTDLPTPGRSIVCGGSGTLRVTTRDGNVRDIPASLVSAGVPMPLQVMRVHNSGTTATEIYVYV
jgi:hypothetical protein